MVELLSPFFWKPRRQKDFLSERLDPEEEEEEEEKRTERRKKTRSLVLVLKTAKGGLETRAKRKGRGRGVLCRPWDKP